MSVTPVHLSPLRTIGTSFADANGRLLTYAGLSEFRLLDRFLRGQDIEPIFADRLDLLAETQAAPFARCLRVFGMANSFMQLRPQEHGDYYTSVRALVDFAAQHGFYTDFDVFADAQIIMPDVNQQRAHWGRLADQLRGCETVILSVGNEWGAHSGYKNGFDPGDFTYPSAGYLCSRGSDVGDSDPYLPAWDVSKYHGRRDDLKGELSSCDIAWAVSGYDGEHGNAGFAGTHQPTYHDEPIGAADVSIRNKRSAVPAVFYRLAFDCSTWGAGGTFHSDCGIDSVPFTARQRACGLAWFMGQAKADPAQRHQG